MKIAFAAILLGAAPAALLAQPDAPATEDYLCQATPPAVLTANDTLPYAPDSLGFTSLFDGTSFKGWWHNCNSGHTGDKIRGAIFRIDPKERAIYSNQRGTNGGLILTKKKYDHYEVIFDFWPDFGNDGGFFHRTTADGTCYQTVIDYLKGASFLGSYPEGKPLAQNIKPFTFGDDESSIVPSGGWTTNTAKMNPLSFGCSAGGCVQADWRNLWNMNDWNQVRVLYYGGITSATKIHMKSFFRKDAGKPWVPVLFDSVSKTDPPGYIGFQVHGGGSFKGPRGNWYRNIKVRYLTSSGDPREPILDAARPQTRDVTEYRLHANPQSLLGYLDLDYAIILRDLQGSRLESFSGRAGIVNHSFRTPATGLLAIEIRTVRGMSRQIISRLR